MTTLEVVPTGTIGLDEVLNGGLPARRLYLFQGDPGVGKTTMALRFLIAGAERGESCLYVTLSETREELNGVAESHGWTLKDVHVYELSAADSGPSEHDENTLYVPAEVELGERVLALLAEVDRVRPTRVVIDSCSELRLLAQNPLRFRRQLLALKEQLVRRNCTILLLENPTSTGGDPLLQSLVHGVIVMEQLAPLYGAERRRLRVVKLREVSYRGGFHDMVIRKGGVIVYPRLVAADHHQPFSAEVIKSGVPELDSLLGGGLDRGTSALLTGPTGSGKSTIAIQYSVAAAMRGEFVAYFTFDESVATLRSRAAGLNLSLEPHIESGLVHVQQVDPAELPPGEFVHIVREAVEKQNAKIIVIDSLNGFLQAMPEEHYLEVQLHEQLSYLRQHGVVTLLLMAQHGFVGNMEGPLDVSYLADTVLVTRYFEAAGRVRKALSVLKKRTGTHEDTIREFALNSRGLRVGRPLTNFHGVLTGVPEYDGNESAALLEKAGLER
ncbi:MAG TPA: ATPase domain-containing protein [Polyangiales bacterium]|nr:ATPase domain-containing protein [Polyangiales bacterium]